MGAYSLMDKFQMYCKQYAMNNIDVCVISHICRSGELKFHFFTLCSPYGLVTCFD